MKIPKKLWYKPFYYIDIDGDDTLLMAGPRGFGFTWYFDDEYHLFNTLKKAKVYYGSLHFNHDGFKSAMDIMEKAPSLFVQAFTFDSVLEKL